MPIEKISGVYLDEEVDYELSGTGSKIPIFIGLTGNSGTTDYKVDGTNVLKFTNYDELNRATTAGGIGAVDASATTSTNILNLVLRNFYEEARLKQPDDVGVIYIYCWLLNLWCYEEECNFFVLSIIGLKSICF